jgi:hypothetical protein
MDIDKLNNYLKIIGIINNMFRPKRKRTKLYTIHKLFKLCYRAVKTGPSEQEMQQE